MDNGGTRDNDDGLARIVVHDARASGHSHVPALSCLALFVFCGPCASPRNSVAIPDSAESVRPRPLLPPITQLDRLLTVSPSERAPLLAVIDAVHVVDLFISLIAPSLVAPPSRCGSRSPTRSSKRSISRVALSANIVEHALQHVLYKHQPALVSSSLYL